MTKASFGARAQIHSEKIDPDRPNSKYVNSAASSSLLPGCSKKKCRKRRACRPLYRPRGIHRMRARAVLERMAAAIFGLRRKNLRPFSGAF
jgi:hypothetical protein